jgi:hypothetical protein
MAAWFSRTPSKAKPRGLVQQLSIYPPYRAPFAGPADRLSDGQAAANLQYLLEHREERLRILGGLLGEHGIDVHAGMQAQDIDPMLAELRQWAKAQWPEAYTPAIAKRANWHMTSRDGDEIIYSLLMDVAILLGELVIARRSHFSWQVDLNRIPGKDQMTSYKRVVVGIPRSEVFPAPIVLDVEDTVVSEYLNVRSPLFGRFDDLTRSVSEAVKGKYEQFWMEEARQKGLV